MKALKKDFFESEEFKAKAKNLVLVMIDFPMRDDIIPAEQKANNLKVIEKYNKGKSFPLILAFTSNFKQFDEISSYSPMMRDPQYHFAFLERVLNK